MLLRVGEGIEGSGLSCGCIEGGVRGRSLRRLRGPWQETMLVPLPSAFVPSYTADILREAAFGLRLQQSRYS